MIKSKKDDNRMSKFLDVFCKQVKWAIGYAFLIFLTILAYAFLAPLLLIFILLGCVATLIDKINSLILKKFDS